MAEPAARDELIDALCEEGAYSAHAAIYMADAYRAQVLAEAQVGNAELRQRIAEWDAVLREVRSDLAKLYAALPAGLDFYLDKIRLTRQRIDAALGDEHFASPTT